MSGGVTQYSHEGEGESRKTTRLPLNFASPPYALINESPLIKYIMLCYKHPLSNKRPAMKLYTFVLLHKQTTYCMLVL